MRPTLFPNNLALPQPLKRLIVAPPSGDLNDPDISPIEAIVGKCILPNFDCDEYMVKIVLEPGDIEDLTTNSCFYIVFMGAVVPFRFHPAREVTLLTFDKENKDGSSN